MTDHEAPKLILDRFCIQKPRHDGEWLLFDTEADDVVSIPCSLALTLEDAARLAVWVDVCERRAYGHGIKVGRDALARDLRKLIGCPGMPDEEG